MVSRILTAAGVTLMMLAACSDSTEPRVPTNLELDRTTLQLALHESQTISARVVDQNGNAFQQVPDGFEIQWSSDDNSVAQVSQGNVLGAAIGTAVVTARAGELPPVQVMVEVTSGIQEFQAELSLDYAGDESGVFEIDAEFTFTPQAGPEGPAWALTFYDTGFGSQDIVAQRERDDGRFDLIWLWAEIDPVIEAGQAALDDGLFLFGVSDTWLEVNQNSTLEAIYSLEEGAVAFTSVTEDRMAGEFSGDMEGDGDLAVELTGGEFDLPSLQLGGFTAPPAAFGADLSSVRERIMSLVR